MTRTAVVIPVDGDPYRLDLADDEAGSLRQMQEVVGGYIEAVYVEWPLPTSGLIAGMLMWVNEEGKLHGLPRNRTASLIANQVIAGNVLLTGEADPEGNEVGLDEETITDLLAANADDMIARSDANIEELRTSDQGGPYVIRCIGHEG